MFPLGMHFADLSHTMKSSVLPPYLNSKMDFFSGMSISQNHIQRLWWRPFFCAISQFTVMDVWSCRKVILQSMRALCFRSYYSYRDSCVQKIQKISPAQINFLYNLKRFPRFLHGKSLRMLTPQKKVKEV